MNSLAAREYAALGLAALTLSPELTLAVHDKATDPGPVSRADRSAAAGIATVERSTGTSPAAPITTLPTAAGSYDVVEYRISHWLVAGR